MKYDYLKLRNNEYFNDFREHFPVRNFHTLINNFRDLERVIDKGISQECTYIINNKIKLYVSDKDYHDNNLERLEACYIIDSHYGRYTFKLYGFEVRDGWNEDEQQYDNYYFEPSYIEFD